MWCASSAALPPVAGSRDLPRLLDLQSATVPPATEPSSCRHGSAAGRRRCCAVAPLALSAADSVQSVCHHVDSAGSMRITTCSRAASKQACSHSQAAVAMQGNCRLRSIQPAYLRHQQEAGGRYRARRCQTMPRRGPSAGRRRQRCRTCGSRAPATWRQMPRPPRGHHRPRAACDRHVCWRRRAAWLRQRAALWL